MFLVIVDQLVKAFGNKLIGSDAPGDERRQIRLPALHQCKGVRMVIGVAVGAAQVDFLRDQLGHVHLRLMPKNHILTNRRMRRRLVHMLRNVRSQPHNSYALGSYI